MPAISKSVSKLAGSQQAHAAIESERGLLDFGIRFAISGRLGAAPGCPERDLRQTLRQIGGNRSPSW